MKIELLDHGYLTVVESWGSDQAIIEAARMSTDKGFLGWGPRACKACGEVEPKNCASHKTRKGDEGLLGYLWRNKHATPFEMAGLILEVKAPIMVFREWHRHRTQSYNEMSARYIPLPDENYVPSVERLMQDGGRNKQAMAAAGVATMTEAAARGFRSRLEDEYARQQLVYEDALAAGVPKELARMVLPVGRYSKMRASANLRNWLAFLTLRMNPHAQYEIRVYANAVGTIIAERFPRTWKLFKVTLLDT